MAKKMYSEYLEKYLLELNQTSTTHKVLSGVLTPLLVGAAGSVYKIIRAATSECYRKCFGDHLIWTSALCQDMCKLEGNQKMIKATQGLLSKCKNPSCREEYRDKLMKLVAKNKELKSKIAYAKAKGKTTMYAQ